MNDIIQKIEEILTIMGFENKNVVFDSEHRKIFISINDNIIKNTITIFLPALEHFVNLLADREEGRQPPYILDINYYRRERERLIVELTKAAARKAMFTKDKVELPAMNAYERRLVHLEIVSNPELTTESVDFGKNRRVIIKYLTNNQ